MEKRAQLSQNTMAQLQSEFITLKTEDALEITLFKAVTATASPSPLHLPSS